MGRKRLIEIDELLKLIDRFLYEELGGNPEKLTAANISRYLKRNGLNIEPRIISRDEIAMAHIRSLQNVSVSVPSSASVVFKPLDIDAFLRTNASVQALKSALIQRDQYYSHVSDAAVAVLTKYSELEAKYDAACHDLDAAGKELHDALESISKYQNEISILKSNNHALRKTLDSYIKPAIANELLRKDGYLSPSTETLVTSNSFDEKIISADTDVSSPLMQDMLCAFED